MKVTNVKITGCWRDVADAARTTMGKEEGSGEPSSQWKIRMLKAEHSPIRKLFVSWKWIDLPYWVSVHFVRHKIGIEHFVSTQRSDRTGEERSDKRQDALVSHECIANAQAIINISRKRLCNLASPETHLAWFKLIEEIRKAEPELAEACVPDCVYRGKCHEMKPCGKMCLMNNQQINNTSYYKLPCGRFLEDFIAKHNMSFAMGSALKYLWRAGNKDGESKEKDSAKYRHYRDFIFDPTLGKEAEWDAMFDQLIKDAKAWDGK